MPFVSDEPTEEFIFVNKDDPDGKKGLKPFSWNLETEVESDEGTPKEKRRVVFGADGEPKRITRDDPRFSVWDFASFMRQTDRSTIDRKVSRSSISVDARKARKLGRNYSPEIKSEALMDATVALITTMSRGWRGLEFVVPIWWKDANRNRHPLAGTLAPCTAEWVGTRSTVELAALEQFLNDLYEPNGEDDEEAEAQQITRQEYFPQESVGVAGPGSSEV